MKNHIIFQNKFAQKKGTDLDFCKSFKSLQPFFFFDTLFVIYLENWTSTKICSWKRNNHCSSISYYSKNTHEIILVHSLLLISQLEQIDIDVFIQPPHFFRNDGQGRIYRRCKLTNTTQRRLIYLNSRRLINEVLQSIMAKCYW